jgi:tetratricopeptide (TPR) repeat protein
MTDRLEALRKLAAANPADVFAHYALAMALAGAGQPAEAVAEFEQALALDANYTVTYFQMGQALEKLGRLEEARRVYQRGLEVTARLGQAHAREQLESALELLG